MLDVMCHMLDVRCHMLDVMCHMLDVKCRMLNVMCDMLNVMCQVSHARCHVSHARCYVHNVSVCTLNDCKLFGQGHFKSIVLRLVKAKCLCGWPASRPTDAHLNRSCYTVVFSNKPVVSLNSSHVLREYQVCVNTTKVFDIVDF